MDGKFILLVEDHYSDELLTRRAFARNGIEEQLLVVRDGAEALRFLLSGEPLPALVLLDISLPRMNGFEVLRKLRVDERTRTLPVIMLTGSGEAEDRQKAMQWELDGYIRKPVIFTEFVEIVRQLGLYWLRADVTVSSGMEGPT
jgi:two-component system response regulator